LTTAKTAPLKGVPRTPRRIGVCARARADIWSVEGVLDYDVEASFPPRYALAGV
jgi:hypothetical protein